MRSSFRRALGLVVALAGSVGLVAGALPSPAAAAEAPLVEYRAHVAKKGWLPWVADGEVAGAPAGGNAVEAIEIRLTAPGYTGTLLARASFVDVISMPFVKPGNIVGTTGLGREIDSFELQLTGDLAATYDLYLRVHVDRLGWLGWTQGPAGSFYSYDMAIDAVQLDLVAAGSPAPSGTALAGYYHITEGVNALGASAHVQQRGWIDAELRSVSGGWIRRLGTTGNSLRLEAIRFDQMPYYTDGDLEASAHVQKLGWLPPVPTEQIVGTEGRGLRVEAFTMRLTGPLADQYDLYYRAHAQNFGWLGWARNGEQAGTAGYGYRLEAVEYVTVPKGYGAPGTTTRPFVGR